MTAIAKPRNTASASPAASSGASPASRAQDRKSRVTKAPATGAAVNAVPTGRDLLVPLDKLSISETNVRKVHHEEGLIELATLIEVQGLLQRLSVVAHAGTHEEGRFAVVAGGRRLRAMQLLAASGRWDATHPVECKLYDA